MSSAGYDENLVHRGDLDELVAEVDRLAGQQRWDGLIGLRDACLAATELTGRQLWPAAHFADYRLALDAPPHPAAAVVQPGAARFALGPLTEVVAQAHTFDGLSDLLDPISCPIVAHERILRGEDLRDDPRAIDDLELPRILQPWEPSYLLPTYRSADRLDGQLHAPAALQTAEQVSAIAPVTGTTDVPGTVAEVVRALRDLAVTWVETSSGTLRVAAGSTPQEAIGRTVDREVVAVPLTLPEAFQRMAFAAAAGGTYGHRRGGYAGRASAWWVGMQATGVGVAIDPDELEFRLEDLAWFDFGGEPEDGWQLCLAVANESEGWAAAISAFDAAESDATGETDSTITTVTW